MSFSVKQRTDFGAAVKALRETAAGKEATMSIMRSISITRHAFSF